MFRRGKSLRPAGHDPYGGIVDLEPTVTRLRAAGCVFAEDEAALLLAQAAEPGELKSMVDRRVAGEPLEQILGWAWFHGRRIAMEPGVFVPRRRTEFLVDLAVSLVRPGSVVVDLCCGSGAIGAAVADAVGTIDLYAVDVDAAAVRCARRNVPASATVYQGDLFDPLPAALRGAADVLTANVPYVPSEEIATMPPEARYHEPRAALDGGSDGLEVLRRVAGEAKAWLTRGGHLLIETSDHQATYAAEIFASHGLRPSVEFDDELDARVVVGLSI
jgi:release factor glutamine methyltransferase